MTRPHRSPKEIHAVTMQLADIIRDHFDHDGQIITHSHLAEEHVSRNKSVSALEDVQVYGGPAVVHLRYEENYAIVPITASIAKYSGDPDDVVEVTNAVAGLGAGGARVGWYHPASKDDWLWIYYVGHLGRSGVKAVFHAGEQIDKNPHLISVKGREEIAAKAVAGVPVPPDETERKVLAARIDS